MGARGIGLSLRVVELETTVTRRASLQNVRLAVDARRAAFKTSPSPLSYREAPRLGGFSQSFGPVERRGRVARRGRRGRLSLCPRCLYSSTCVLSCKCLASLGPVAGIQFSTTERGGRTGGESCCVASWDKKRARNQQACVQEAVGSVLVRRWVQESCIHGAGRAFPIPTVPVKPACPLSFVVLGSGHDSVFS